MPNAKGYAEVRPKMEAALHALSDLAEVAERAGLAGCFGAASIARADLLDAAEFDALELPQ